MPLVRSAEEVHSEEDRDVWDRLLGQVPYQKGMSLYTKTLERLVSEGGLTIRLEVEFRPEEGLYEERVEEIKGSLRELGLSEDISRDAHSRFVKYGVWCSD